MNEHSKHEHSPAPQQVDLDMFAVLKKIQQQLTFLERKIDTLMKQPPERPFRDRERPFSKPFRPGGFGQQHRRDRGERGERPRERSFAPGRPSFDKPQGGENPAPERGRKAFFKRRKERG